MHISTHVYSSFSAKHHLEKNSNKQNKQLKTNKQKEQFNVPVLVTSTVGTLIPVLFFMKKQNKSFLKLDLGLAEILSIGTSAVLGGLAGGIATDKRKNTWGKIKEANFQLLTNIITPMIFVEHIRELAEKQVPKTAGKFKHVSAKIGAIGSGLILGMFAGSMLSDFVNNKIIRKGDPFKRSITFKDLLIQIDDVSSAIALAKIHIGNFSLSQAVSKIVPFVFIFAGYETGKK